MKKIDPRINKNLFQLGADIYDALEEEESDTKAIELLEDYGKWVWNKALEWVKENAKIKKTEELTTGTYDSGSSTSYCIYEDDGRYCTNFFIDKESIDNGKIK